MTEASLPAWIWRSHMQKLSRELSFIAQNVHLFVGLTWIDALNATSLVQIFTSSEQAHESRYAQVNMRTSGWDAHTAVSSEAWAKLRTELWIVA